MFVVCFYIINEYTVFELLNPFHWMESRMTLSLEDFLVRARVVKLYRHALRISRRAPSHARGETYTWKSELISCCLIRGESTNWDNNDVWHLFLFSAFLLFGFFLSVSCYCNLIVWSTHFANTLEFCTLGCLSHWILCIK